MQKKGVSEVVTAILLVLLAIAAVIIVWGVVKGFMTSTAVGSAAGCASVDLEITKASATSGSNVIVKRNPNQAGEVTLKKIRFVFENITGSYPQLPVDVQTSLTELASVTFTVNGLSTVGNGKLLVYPMIGTDAEDKLCPLPAVATVTT